jgi:hypothetical protein
VLKIKKHLLPTIKFIDYHIENNKNILIHCKSGHRRSVCIIVYYLMKKYEVSHDAYEVSCDAYDDAAFEHILIKKIFIFITPSNKKYCYIL